METKRCPLCGKKIKEEEKYCKEDRPFAEKVMIVANTEFGDILNFARNFFG